MYVLSAIGAIMVNAVPAHGLNKVISKVSTMVTPPASVVTSKT